MRIAKGFIKMRIVKGFIKMRIVKDCEGFKKNDAKKFYKIFYYYIIIKYCVSSIVFFVK